MKKLTNIKVVLIILVLLFIGGGIYLLSSKNKKVEKNSVPNKENVEAVIPTTDASTVATLTTLNSGKEITLKMEGIPAETLTIDYELSYSTKQQGFQGVIGTIALNKKEKIIEKKITLGTCSSGKCVYHEVVGAIKTTLKFNGSYREKILEKEFNL